MSLIRALVGGAWFLRFNAGTAYRGAAMMRQRAQFRFRQPTIGHQDFSQLGPGAALRGERIVKLRSGDASGRDEELADRFPGAGGRREDIAQPGPTRAEGFDPPTIRRSKNQRPD